MSWQVIAHPSLEHRLEHLSQIISENPTDANLLIQRSLLLQDKQEWEQALNDLYQAQKLPTNNPDLPFYLGFLAYQQHQFCNAIQFLTAYINQTAVDSNLLIKAETLLGEIFTQQQHHLSAAKHFYKALELTKKPPAHLYLTAASAYVNAGSSQLNTVEIIIAKGLTTYPAYLPLLELQIYTQQKSNNHDAAKLGISSLLHHYPNHPRWTQEQAKLEANTP